MRCTFRTPGTYKVVCFEFCGVGHHLMTGKVIVLPAANAEDAR